MTSSLRIFALVAGMGGLSFAQLFPAPAAAQESSFTFRGVAYFHRWSKNDQHEFTPKGQEDLQQWADMITINLYPDAHDGDALAGKANAVLENYKNHNGIVLKTDSVPRTTNRPAEHFISVVFGQPNFLEAAFARFKLMNSKSCSIVYSHRIYGEKVGDQMSAWLAANGAAIEKALMSWKDIPVPAAASRSADRSSPFNRLAQSHTRLTR